SSLSVENMRKRLLEAFPQAKWYEFESISRDNEREGMRIAFGEPVRALPQIEQAKVILSLDADLFGSHPTALQNAYGFAKGRRPVQGEMNRLYAVEPRYTTTGAAADHRLPLPASQMEGFALALIADLLFQQNIPPGMFFKVLTPLFEPYLQHPFDKKWMSALAQDLANNQGKCLVVAGAGCSPLTHIAGAMLNDLLGDTGNTVVYCSDPNPDRPSHQQAIIELTKEINAGGIDTLLIIGGNPVYDAPADLQFGEALKKVPNSIHLSLYPTETSDLSKWYIPQAHYLESWGVARAYDGTITLIQPLIQPLYGGKSAAELLALVMGDKLASGYDLARRALKTIFKSDSFDNSFRYWLHQGFIKNTRYDYFAPWYVNVNIQKVLEQIEVQFPEPKAGDLEIVFYPDSKIYDGRFANNGWLQETPDSLTKLTWDNAALIAPETAKTLGVRQGELIRMNYRGRSIEAAAYIMPGQAENSIAVALGYGRKHAGRVGDGIGFDVQELRTAEAPFFSLGLTIERTGKHYDLAITQDHFAIDAVGMRERNHRIHELIQEATLDNYIADPDYFKHRSHTPEANLWQEHDYPKNRWGMAIDLNACIGCNACMAACQAENNIPVVGKKQVAISREMHWIRVDRFFSGDMNAPRAAYQPVACVHCENAPCEQVCP
ncbi:MAG: 4Fe-4S dicluster domain-containing protein, partial [Candidatus Hinthialibacter sp.]